MTKEEFDKMLKVAILEDKMKYVSGLICELQNLIPSYSEALEIFGRNIRKELQRQKQDLDVFPLCYELFSECERPKIQGKSNEDFWEQRRFELAKDILCTNAQCLTINNIYDHIKDAIGCSYLFVDEYKERENERANNNN